MQGTCSPGFCCKPKRYKLSVYERSGQAEAVELEAVRFTDFRRLVSDGRW